MEIGASRNRRTWCIPAMACVLAIADWGLSEEWKGLRSVLNDHEQVLHDGATFGTEGVPVPRAQWNHQSSLPPTNARAQLRQRNLSEQLRRSQREKRQETTSQRQNLKADRSPLSKTARLEPQVTSGPTSFELAHVPDRENGEWAELPTALEATPAPQVAPTKRDKAERLHVVQYEGVTLSTAMKLFSDQTGHNVICSADAGRTEITVYLRDVTPLDALKAIVKANGLFFRADEESGIVRISTSEEYAKDLTQFREEQTRVFTLLYPNPVAVAQVISQVYGQQVELNTADADFDQLADLSQRFSRFDLVDGRSLGLGTLDTTAQAGSRGTRLSNSAGGLQQTQGLPLGGNLSARSRTRTNPTRQEERRLEDLSADEIQDIEDERASTGDISEADRARLMRRGNATIYVSTIRRNNQVVVRTSDPQSMSEIEQLVAQLDVPTPTVLLEVKVLRIVLADGTNSAFEYFVGEGNTSVGFSDGNLVPSFPGANSASRILANGLGVTGSAPGALTFQIVDNDFQLRMQLLESQSQVTALATPLILTANNEVSRIFVGDTLPFTVGFTPSQVVGGFNAVSGAVAATPITELRDVGQSLLITPSINADRTVTLRVVEENSERVLGGASIPVPDVSGSGVTTVRVDTVRRRTVSGTVVAQDGMAVALGGLIEEQASDATDQVPGLGDVPGLGYFFRRKSTDNRRSELVVVIRPYVFNTPSESAATTQAVLGDLSMHPNSPNAAGTLSTPLSTHAFRTDAECLQRANLFRFHNVRDWD